MPTIASPLIGHSSQENTLVDPGDNVILVCRATGRPTPFYTWLFNDEQIIASSRHVFSGSGDQLEIKQFGSSDQGSYSCVAENRLGLDKRTFTVFIKSE